MHCVRFVWLEHCICTFQVFLRYSLKKRTSGKNSVFYCIGPAILWFITEWLTETEWEHTLVNLDSETQYVWIRSRTQPPNKCVGVGTRVCECWCLLVMGQFSVRAWKWNKICVVCRWFGFGEKSDISCVALYDTRSSSRLSFILRRCFSQAPL